MKTKDLIIGRNSLKNLVYIFSIVGISTFLSVILEEIIFKKDSILTHIEVAYNTLTPVFSLFVAATTLYIIHLTSLRFEQTKEQIDSLNDNNKFNNFFKHKHEFSLFFNNQLDYINHTTKLKYEEFIVGIYSTCYTNKYENFIPKLNEDCEKNINSFMEGLLNNKLLEPEIKLNKSVFRKIKLFSDKCYFYPSFMNEINKIESQLILDYQPRGLYEGINSVGELVLLNNYLNRIIIQLNIISTVLLFDGKEVPDWITFKFFADDIKREILPPTQT